MRAHTFIIFALISAFLPNIVEAADRVADDLWKCNLSIMAILADASRVRRRIKPLLLDYSRKDGVCRVGDRTPILVPYGYLKDGFYRKMESFLRPNLTCPSDCNTINVYPCADDEEYSMMAEILATSSAGTRAVESGVAAEARLLVFDYEDSSVAALYLDRC